MRTLRYVEHLAIQQAYDIKQREFLPPFGAMVGMAFSLHVLVMLIWSLFPNTQPFVMPLQDITVRLGGGEDAARAHAASKKAQDAAQSKKTMPEVVKPQVSSERKQPTVSQPKAQPRRHVAPPTVSPALRHAAASAPAGEGSPYGNSLKGRQVVERYTRQLSLQVQSHAASIRMSSALKAQAQGRRVVVELLLVIGQDGNLLRMSVARSSGFAELDSAAMQAARSAAPYPPPPAEYSGFGFKVAVFVD